MRWDRETGARIYKTADKQLNCSFLRQSYSTLGAHTYLSNCLSVSVSLSLCLSFSKGILSRSLWSQVALVLRLHLFSLNQILSSGKSEQLILTMVVMANMTKYCLLEEGLASYDSPKSGRMALGMCLCWERFSYTSYSRPRSAPTKSYLLLPLITLLGSANGYWSYQTLVYTY